MPSRLISDLDPALQPLAQQFLDRCEAAAIDVFITQTYRSRAEQNADYAQGRITPGHIITKAMGGQSPHNCTLPDGRAGARAFDFAIKLGDGELDWDEEDPDWQDVLAIGKVLGLESGGAWGDYDHFQLPNWKSGPPFTL